MWGDQELLVALHFGESPITFELPDKFVATGKLLICTYPDTGTDQGTMVRLRRAYEARVYLAD